MRKFVHILLLVSLLSLLIVGCNKQQAVITSTATTSAVTTPAATKPVETTPVATTPATTKPAPTPAQPASVFNWKLQTVVDVAHPEYLGSIDWTKQIEQYSGGRMKFSVYAAGTLVNSTEMLDALRSNTIQIGAPTYGGYWQQFMPEGALESGLPMTTKTSAEVFKLFYDLGWMDILKQAYAEQGVYYAAPYVTGTYFPFWAKHPVRTLADLKGLKIRATGATATMFEKLGASPVFLAHSESFTALQLGTITAYCTALALYESNKHYEICKYVMLPSLTTNTANICYSMKGLDSLPEDLKVLMTSNAAWFGSLLTWRYDEEDASMVNRLKARGTEFVLVDDAVAKAMAQVGVGFLDDYANKNSRCAKMVEILKTYLKGKGYI